MRYLREKCLESHSFIPLSLVIMAVIKNQPQPFDDKTDLSEYDFMAKF